MDVDVWATTLFKQFYKNHLSNPYTYIRAIPVVYDWTCGCDGVNLLDVYFWDVGAGEVEKSYDEVYYGR